MPTEDWFVAYDETRALLEDVIPRGQYWTYQEVIVDLNTGVVEALHSVSGKWHKAQLTEKLTKDASAKAVRNAIDKFFERAEVVYI